MQKTTAVLILVAIILSVGAYAMAGAAKAYKQAAAVASVSLVVSE